MANSFHQLTIVGNLGRDPEMRFTPSGQPVTTMSVATTRTYMKGEEKVDETCWFRVTVWGKPAENCNNYLKKGAKVLVLGRLIPDKGGNPRIWTKQDGTSGASFEVNAHEVHFLTSSNGNGQSMGVTEEQPGEEIQW